MTPLAATYPEPRGDLRAQFAVLDDPAHPKRAVWVSWGSVGNDRADGFVIPRVGTLYASEDDCGRLADDPSLEMLAKILDYVECRSPGLSGFFQLPVVQALSPAGWVVQEQLVSWGRVGEARRRASAYGGVRVVSVAA